MREETHAPVCLTWPITKAQPQVSQPQVRKLTTTKLCLSQYLGGSYIESVFLFFPKKPG